MILFTIGCPFTLANNGPLRISDGLRWQSSQSCNQWVYDYSRNGSNGYLCTSPGFTQISTTHRSLTVVIDELESRINELEARVKSLENSKSSK